MAGHSEHAGRARGPQARGVGRARAGGLVRRGRCGLARRAPRARARAHGQAWATRG